MKVDDYGEMLAKVTGKRLIAYNEFGSYQGDWVATLDAGNSIELWKGYYGSCSGCDWLQAERDWHTSEVPLDKAMEYFKEDKPFAVIPKEVMERIDVETFETMLPRNTRTIWDFNVKELFDKIKAGLKEKTKITFDEVKELYYKTHTCQSDDADSEQAKIERWAEEMGYEVID